MIRKTRVYKLAQAFSKLNDEMLWFMAVDKDEFIDFYVQLVQGQLQQGINADGDEFGQYSFATEIITGGRKKEGDPYTLEDTGYFYKSMLINVMPNMLIFDNDPMKNGDSLYELYGNNITGLTYENFELLKKKVAENYRSIIRGILSEIR